MASVRPGEDLYLVLWIRVFHSVEVNFISSGLTVWTAQFFRTISLRGMAGKSQRPIDQCRAPDVFSQLPLDTWYRK